MAEQTVELRGIPLSHLITYLAECGGVPLGDTLPITVRGERWQAELLREETIPITSRFEVQAVFIRFQADDQGTLDRLWERFRIKVLRVGG